MALLIIWLQEKIAHNHAKLIICNFKDFDVFNLSFSETKQFIWAVFQKIFIEKVQIVRINTGFNDFS